MNQNLEKALYLGTGLLLCLLSMTIFFNHYKVFQSYISGQEGLIQKDKLVVLGQEKLSQGISYEEVLFKVIEVKELQETRELSEIYSSPSYFDDSHGSTPGAIHAWVSSPQVWVNGTKAENLDIGTLSPDMVFQCTQEADEKGRIIVLRYASIR